MCSARLSEKGFDLDVPLDTSTFGDHGAWLWSSPHLEGVFVVDVDDARATDLVRVDDVAGEER